MRRVVITGLGVVSPIGIGVDPFWKALVIGTSGGGGGSHAMTRLVTRARSRRR